MRRLMSVVWWLPWEHQHSSATPQHLPPPRLELLVIPSHHHRCPCPFERSGLSRRGGTIHSSSSSPPATCSTASGSPSSRPIIPNRRALAAAPIPESRQTFTTMSPDLFAGAQRPNPVVERTISACHVCCCPQTCHAAAASRSDR